MNIKFSNKNKLKKVVLSAACASMAICGLSQSAQSKTKESICMNRHKSVGDFYLGLASNFGSEVGEGKHSLYDPNSIAQTQQTRTNQYLMNIKSNFCDWSVLFGGAVELDQQVWSGTITPYLFNDGDPDPKPTSGKGAYLTYAAFNTFMNLGKYVSAYISLTGSTYDPQAQHGPASEDSNRVVNVDNAIALIGNLDEFPVYGFVGLGYLPFGDFTDISDFPILGLNSAYFYGANSYEQAGLAFDKHNKNYSLNVTAALIMDPVNSMTQSQHFDNFAVNVSNTYNFGKMGLRLGAGFLKDVQRTKLMWFRNDDAGFGLNSYTGHNLPAGSVTAELSYNSMFSLRADYAQILKYADYGKLAYGIAFHNNSPEAPSMIQHRKKPGSFTVQGLFQAPLAGRLTVFRVLYSKTRQMKNVPGAIGSYDMTAIDPYGLKDAWQVFVTRSIFSDNFYVSAMFQRSQNYNGQHSNLFTLDELIEW